MSFQMFSVHPPKSKKGGLFDQRVIPPDVINLILRYLNRSDIKNLNATNQYFHGLIKYDIENIPLPRQLNIYKYTVFDDPLSEIDIENTMNKLQNKMPEFNWNDGPYYFVQTLYKTTNVNFMVRKVIYILKGSLKIRRDLDNYKNYYMTKIFKDLGYENNVTNYDINLEEVFGRHFALNIEQHINLESFGPLLYENKGFTEVYINKMGFLRLI